MTLTRLCMIIGLILLLAGLVYGFTHPDPSKAMMVELTCLLLGALLFYGAFAMQRKRRG